MLLMVLASGCSSQAGKLVKYEMTYNSAKIYNTSKVKKVRDISLNMPFFNYLDAYSQEKVSNGLYTLNYDLSYDGVISDVWIKDFKDACIKITEYSSGIQIPINYNGNNPSFGDDIKDISGCIKNPLLYEYHKTASDIKIVKEDVSKLKKSLPKGIKTLLNQLQNNKSYSSGNCKILPIQYIPSRPKTICDNPEELAQARLACLAPLGSKVCRSLTDGKAEKFIAGNACSAALKGQLNSSDLIFEALDSAAEELEDNSGSFSDRAGSLVSGVLSFARLMETYSCVDGLFPGCESKIKNWEIEVDKIKRFPYENKNECDVLLTKYKKISKENQGVQNKIDMSEKKLNKLLTHIETVKSKTYSGTF